MEKLAVTENQFKSIITALSKKYIGKGNKIIISKKKPSNIINFNSYKGKEPFLDQLSNSGLLSDGNIFIKLPNKRHDKDLTRLVLFHELIEAKKVNKLIRGKYKATPSKSMSVGGLKDIKSGKSFGFMGHSSPEVILQESNVIASLPGGGIKN